MTGEIGELMELRLVLDFTDLQAVAEQVAQDAAGQGVGEDDIGVFECLGALGKNGA
ncbi:hypothetical protein GCM10011428_60640 [Streptomyces violaceus]|uniref:hypothetical protein n=1 Tax=Streptomyces TaxID=1883 RepID=UPI00287F9C66|nr:hypothetical protein [Streptomyces sp. CGMCC 4.1456]WNF67319.1 hypothetical protein RJD14_34285 [Streptomyces sp. CGMCC 4.1456]